MWNALPTETEPLPLSGQCLLLKLRSLKPTLNKSKVRAPLMALVTVSPVSYFLRAALAQSGASVGSLASPFISSLQKNDIPGEAGESTQGQGHTGVTLSLSFRGLGDNAKEVIMQRLIFKERR